MEEWDELSSRIDATKTALYALAGSSDTIKERHENRCRRNEIAGVDEALDETHTLLTRLADAEMGYVALERETREAIAQGWSGDPGPSTWPYHA